MWPEIPDQKGHGPEDDSFKFVMQMGERRTSQLVRGDISGTGLLRILWL